MTRNPSALSRMVIGKGFVCKSSDGGNDNIARMALLFDQRGLKQVDI
jgi:hypothetical protein